MYVAININQLKSPYHHFRSAFLILIMGSQHGGFIYIFRLQKFSDMPDPVFFLDQYTTKTHFSRRVDFSDAQTTG